MQETQYSKFDSKSENYEKGRPAYPESAIHFLIKEMELNAEMTIADVGAGTGLLTRSLRHFFSDVIAIEPNDEMRPLIGSSAIQGTAEDTKLPDCSVNTVFAAQAFHWFDIKKARSEFKRILKPPFGVVLLWNDRDKGSNPGLIELEKIMNALRGNSQQILEADESAIKSFYGLSELNKAEFANPVKLSKDSFCAMVLSRSYAPKLNTPEFIDLSKNLNAFFDLYSTESQLVIPYKTQVYWGWLNS